MFKIKAKIRKCQNKIEKNFFFQVIASEDVAINYLY